MTNDMDLRNFPFDSDAIRISILQQVGVDHDKWMFVPMEDEGDVANSVKVFYNIFDTPEFDIAGYSLDCYRTSEGKLELVGFRV